MGKVCKNCGGDLSAARKGAKFCTSTCRSSYHNKINAGKPNANKGLMGVDPVQEDPQVKLKPEAKQTEEPREKEIPKPPKLRNTMWVNVNKDEEQADALGNEQEDEIPEEEPPQFIEKTIQSPNPAFKKYEVLLSGSKQRKEDFLREIKKVEADLKTQEARNGTDIVIFGTLAGGVLGLIHQSGDAPEEGDMTLLNKKGEKLSVFSKKGKLKKVIKKEEPDWTSRLLKAILGGLIGTGLGYAGKKLTEKQREEDKKQKITLLNKKLLELREQLELAEHLLDMDQKSLDKEPRMLATKEKSPNPDYERYLQNQKNKAASKEKEDELEGTDGFVPKSKRVYSAKSFGKEPMEVLKFEGPWLEFFDTPSLNFHCLVHGEPGEGKSTFCLWFARYLAENYGRVLYITGEEGKNHTFQKKLKFCKAEVVDLYISDIRTGEEFLNEVGPEEFCFIFFDSLHDMDIKRPLMRLICDRFPYAGIVAIEQNNKSGTIFGAQAMSHSFDIVVNVVKFTAETTKNRFKQKGVSLPTAQFSEDFEKGDSRSGLKIIRLNPPNEDEEKREIV